MTTETRKESGPSLIFVIGIVSVFALMIWATLLRKVPMVGQSDPQIVRLKQFAASNRLHWKANITEDGTYYCASLSTDTWLDAVNILRQP